MSEKKPEPSEAATVSQKEARPRMESETWKR
jgi:hypothetical protein